MTKIRNTKTYNKKHVEFIEGFLQDEGLIEMIEDEIGPNYKTVIDWMNDCIIFKTKSQARTIKISDIMEAIKDSEQEYQ